MKAILFTAGLYNILWGASVVFFPMFWFRLGGLEAPNYIQLWQCIGMMVSVFGLGYFIAATNPLRHWPIILVGFLLKLFAVTGFFYGFFSGTTPSVIFNMNFTNDFIWLVPFGIILYNAYKEQYVLDEELIQMSECPTCDLLQMYETDKGENLLEISKKQPVMLIFLRHLGCTFCREALHDISQKRKEIESAGTKIIFIHQVHESEEIKLFKKYGLQDIDRVSDPEHILYKGFGLKRGTIMQLFSPKVLIQAFQVNGSKKVGAGKEQGDIFQMPGVFLITNGQIIKEFIHKTAADIPPYIELAKSN